jgi:hypothetical protein
MGEFGTNTMVKWSMAMLVVTGSSVTCYLVTNGVSRVMTVPKTIFFQQKIIRFLARTYKYGHVTNRFEHPCLKNNSLSIRQHPIWEQNT